MRGMVLRVMWLALLPLMVWSQSASAISEGSDYAKISPALPTSAEGKVEVVEMFWYGCPHCYQLEPHIVDWLKRKADYIEYVRIPAIFNNERWRLHAQAFYAAEVLGVLDKVHMPMFNAIHQQKNPLKDKEAIRKLFGAFGVAGDDFDKAFESFAVQAKVNRAADLSRRYGLSGVPAMIVNGKYRTDGPMAKSYQNMLTVVDELAAREYKPAGQTKP